MSEHGFCFPVQVQDILVGDEITLVQKNVTLR